MKAKVAIHAKSRSLPIRVLWVFALTMALLCLTRPVFSSENTDAEEKGLSTGAPEERPVESPQDEVEKKQIPIYEDSNIVTV